MAELKHHVIRNVDNVADAGDARSFQAVFQPFWGRLDLYVSNDTGGEAPAEFRGLNFDFYGVAGFRRTLSRLGRDMLQRQLVDRGDFAGDSVVAETIGAIRTDFRFNHRAMRAVLDTGYIRAGKREARGELLRRRGNVDEIFQPVVDDFHRLFPLRWQPPGIEVRGVLHSHAAIFLMPAKEFAQRVHHRREIRMAFLRNVRATPQPPGESVPIQELYIRHGVMQEFPAEKKTLYVVALGVGIAHARIIRPVFHENVLVGPGERRLHFTEVPNGDDPALRPQNPPKLRPRFFRLEPVESLAGGHKIGARFGKRGGFRGALHADEAAIRLQMQLARFAHLAIRLHAEDGVAVLQKELAQKARAGADVGDDVAGAKVTFLAQHVQQFGGVARPIAHVIGRAIGEALFGVGESHSRKLSLTSFQLSVKPWRRPTLRSSHHGNWRRKRTSFWKKTWMSSMPYLSMARRSMPMPKAKPLVFLAS